MQNTENLNEASESFTLPYLLFSVGKNIYGISGEYVRSIEKMGEITKIVDADAIIRGGVLYQGKFICLLDMRKLIGLDSQIEEFEKMVQPEQRIKDHELWMSELEKSVREKTEFTLTDDPRQCGFGKWYYGFTTGDTVLKHQLKAIEHPHSELHSTAKLIKNHMKRGEYEEALDVVEKLRSTHYKTTFHILSKLRGIVSDNLKEIFIVIDAQEDLKGVIVDSIVGVEYLEESIKTPEVIRNTPYLEGLRRRKSDNSVVFIVNNNI